MGLDGAALGPAISDHQDRGDPWNSPIAPAETLWPLVNRLVRGTPRQGVCGL